MPQSCASSPAKHMGIGFGSWSHSATKKLSACTYPPPHRLLRSLYSPKSPNQNHHHVCSCICHPTSTRGLLAVEAEAGETLSSPRPPQPRDSIALPRRWPQRCRAGGKHPLACRCLLSYFLPKHPMLSVSYNGSAPCANSLCLRLGGFVAQLKRPEIITH